MTSMGDRRPTRGLNPRVRVAVGAGPSQRERDDALARVLESGDITIETIERIAELIGNTDDPTREPDKTPLGKRRPGTGS
jgi:hypothetical protein